MVANKQPKVVNTSDAVLRLARVNIYTSWYLSYVDYSVVTSCENKDSYSDDTKYQCALAAHTAHRSV